VPRAENDPVYFNTPYYVYPDGPIAEETFRVIGAAMADRAAGSLLLRAGTRFGMRHLAPHLGRRLVLAQPFIDDLA
jgi:hypothetical protein